MTMTKGLVASGAGIAWKGRVLGKNHSLSVSVVPTGDTSEGFSGQALQEDFMKECRVARSWVISVAPSPSQIMRR
ncbi:hypothetical protein BDW62DRAFT_82369 [Aspergillus aurantiobrunneus]